MRVWLEDLFRCPLHSAEDVTTITDIAKQLVEGATQLKNRQAPEDSTLAPNQKEEPL